MNQDHLKRLYGTTPESFKARVVLALQETEAQSVKQRLTTRTILIAAAILVLCLAVAYAAFSSQVAALFGQFYGTHMKNWLEMGDVATPNLSFTLDGVTFTLEEVICRDNGLYGVGTIRPQEGSGTVIIPEDHMPDAPYGYDVHGVGGVAEDAPANAPTIADMAREKGGKLLMVCTLPDQIGVDGRAMLSPGSIGYSLAPQRDGSIRFSFELSDAYAVEEGKTYTIQMCSSVREVTLEGKLLEDTRRDENWTVNIQPMPLGDMN